MTFFPCIRVCENLLRFVLQPRATSTHGSIVHLSRQTTLPVCSHEGQRTGSFGFSISHHKTVPRTIGIAPIILLFPELNSWDSLPNISVLIASACLCLPFSAGMVLISPNYFLLPLLCSSGIQLMSLIPAARPAMTRLFPLNLHYLFFPASEVLNLPTCK